MAKTRDDRYDFARGILMLGVVWGHMITALKYGSDSPSWILAFFRTYDMPAFAFITGIFLKKSIENHSFKENILNKVGMILIPTAIWCLLFNFFIGDFTIHFSEYWFLWATFYSTIIIICVERVFRGKRWLQILALMAFLVITHTGIWDRWNVGFLLFPMIVGYFFDDIKKKLSQRILDLAPWILLGVFTLLQCFWSTDYNVWNAGCNMLADSGRNALFVLYRGVIGLIGSVLMIHIFKWLFFALKGTQNLVTQKILQGGVLLGKVTLEIYILQSVLVTAYGATLVRKVSELMGFNPIIANLPLLNMFIAPILSIIAIIIMYFIQKAIKCIPLIGRYCYGININHLLRGKQ